MSTKESYKNPMNDQLVQCMPAELREKTITKKDPTTELEHEKRVSLALVDQIYRLKAYVSRLTGHAPDCDIEVDPEWRPCTCGRG